MARWLELSVYCSRETVETVANIMNEEGSGGVVIEDPALIVEYLHKGNTETLAPSLKVPPGPEIVVKGYFLCDCSVPDRLEIISRRLKELGVRWRTGEVRDEDWVNSWRAYYKPFKVGKRLVVKPSWENYVAGAGEIVIDMDPGMAFGCGTHETTTMCLELLEDLVRGGEEVYDVGTGSGILAIAAALLGARRVTAVDIDELAVRTAGENAKRNGVADRVVVVRGDLLDNLAGSGADLVVANIVAGVIIRLAPAAAGALKPGGRLIASGIIGERAVEVQTALSGAGFELERELVKGEWVALVSRKV